MVPRPRNKDYCNVCEVRFEDYLEVGLEVCSIRCPGSTLMR